MVVAQTQRGTVSALNQCEQRINSTVTSPKNCRMRPLPSMTPTRTSLLKPLRLCSWAQRKFSASIVPRPMIMMHQHHSFNTRQLTTPMQRYYNNRPGILGSRFFHHSRSRPEQADSSNPSYLPGSGPAARLFLLHSRFRFWPCRAHSKPIPGYFPDVSPSRF